MFKASLFSGPGPLAGVAALCHLRFFFFSFALFGFTRFHCYTNVCFAAPKKSSNAYVVDLSEVYRLVKAVA